MPIPHGRGRRTILSSLSVTNSEEVSELESLFPHTLAPAQTHITFQNSVDVAASFQPASVAAAEIALPIVEALGEALGQNVGS